MLSADKIRTRLREGYINGQQQLESSVVIVASTAIECVDRSGRDRQLAELANQREIAHLLYGDILRALYDIRSEARFLEPALAGRPDELKGKLQEHESLMNHLSGLIARLEALEKP